jgi:hypothetical protein
LSADLALHTVTGRLDAIGVVDEAIQDGVDIGWVADPLAPAGHWKRAANERRATTTAVFENFLRMDAVMQVRGQAVAKPGHSAFDASASSVHPTFDEARVRWFGCLNAELPCRWRTQGIMRPFRARGY